MPGRARWRRLLHEHRAGGTGFVASFDRARGFAELGAFLRVLFPLLLQLRPLGAQYRAAAGDFGQRAFWDRALGTGPAVAHGVPAQRHPSAGAAIKQPAVERPA